ncbi:MAG: LytR C-terminal domain-containing protein [Mycobacteriales bacterium]|nr:LytR C-terminal domain-containing protein [Frankia sp.]
MVEEIPDSMPSTSAAASPSSASTSAPSATTRPVLTVLNASRRSGLAARAAAKFESAGWLVAEVGNTRLRVAVTTAYYGPGLREAALDLQRAVPAVRRVAPRPASLRGPLVVVVTRDFPA